jgi:hypothetical protein
MDDRYLTLSHAGGVGVYSGTQWSWRRRLCRDLALSVAASG